MLCGNTRWRVQAIENRVAQVVIGVISDNLVPVAVDELEPAYLSTLIVEENQDVSPCRVHRVENGSRVRRRVKNDVFPVRNADLASGSENLLNEGFCEPPLGLDALDQCGGRVAKIATLLFIENGSVEVRGHGR